MNTRRKLLADASFGSRIAEDEVDELHSYFVETEQWRKVIAGEVDIIFGAKGAGKSAIYSLLVAQKEHLRLGRRTIFLAAENPRGTPAFKNLTVEPVFSEENFRGLWKLYFLCVTANYIRHHLTMTKTTNEFASEVIDILSKNGLLEPNVSLMTRLKAVYEYLHKYLPTFEAGITEPNSGVQISGKITLAEPSTEERGLGFRSLDDLLHKLNCALQQNAITCWLVLDRLDVAFSDTPELEAAALRSLFRTYLDMTGLSHVKIKIFLRDDVWKRIVAPGLREASHITRTLNLGWDQQSLLNLIVRRLASNIHICDYYDIKTDELFLNAKMQEDFFAKVFPKQVDIGKSKPATLDWMLSRTADGTKRTAPRELIHLLNEARDEQLKRYHNGNSEPDGDIIFDKLSIRSALPAVSKARYEQTLCAEYPVLKCSLDFLEGEKTQQTISSLSKLWKCNDEKASEIAEKLVEVGFFERRGTKECPNFWVPFLYRDALKMVQGPA